MAKDDLMDDRFSSIFTDPKFKKPRKHERKVKIDKRFQSMFTNKSFKVKYKVDKRGRPVSKSSTEDFKKFYDLPSDDDTKDSVSNEESVDSEPENEPTSGTEAHDFPKVLTTEREDYVITQDIREKLKDMSVDYARGEGRLFSESSSDESESEESDYDDLYHEWNELDKDAGTIDEITNRLAICNMDWDRIRAIDLMMLLNSFLPTGVTTESVIIYPSEYGLQRMKEEELKGPAELVNATETTYNSDSDEDGEGKEFHTERMRQYQLNRLKYYYAIATFDTPQSADIVYTNCNGLEYESSGIRLDLRFVEEDTTFDQVRHAFSLCSLPPENSKVLTFKESSEPKDKCYGADDPESYVPRHFTNSALQQAKVELTWDETDPKRAEFAQKIAEAAKSGDVNDSDLEDFVALSGSENEDEDDDEAGDKCMTFEDELSDESDDKSEEEEDKSEEEDDDAITSYRKLMQEIKENHERDCKDEDEDEEELEITWGSGNSKNKSVIKKNDSKKEDTDDLTPFERLIQKKKEKSKLNKIKKKPVIEEPEVDEKTSSKIKRKQNKGDNKRITEADETQRRELELLLADDNDNGKHHFSLKKILKNESKSKKKKFKKGDKSKSSEAVDDFRVDVKDERFDAIYTSHLFNIDPTNPKFHKTKGMDAFVSEKQKRLTTSEKHGEKYSDEPHSKKKKVSDTDSDLSFLVKSVKSKSMLSKNLKRK